MERVIMLRCECGCGQLFPKEEMETISIKIKKAKSHNIRIVSDSVAAEVRPAIPPTGLKPVPMPAFPQQDTTPAPEVIVAEPTNEEKILKKVGVIDFNSSIEGKHEPRALNEHPKKRNPVPPGFTALAIPRDDPRFETQGAKETRMI